MKIGQRHHTELTVLRYNAQDSNNEKRKVSKIICSNGINVGSKESDVYTNNKKNNKIVTSGIDMSLNVEDVFPYLEFTDSTCSLRYRY